MTDFTVAPVVRKARCGWIAHTPPEHPYRVGVQGGTAEEARELFFKEMAEWAELDRRRRRFEPKPPASSQEQES